MNSNVAEGRVFLNPESCTQVALAQVYTRRKGMIFGGEINDFYVLRMGRGVKCVENHKKKPINEKTHTGVLRMYGTAQVSSTSFFLPSLLFHFSTLGFH